MQTSISKTGCVECRICGSPNEIDIDRPLGYARCECGHVLQYGQPKATLREAFALFGYTLSVDYDGELFVESEEDVPEGVRQWLFDHQGEIRERFKFARRKAQAQFIGGSMNNKRHGHYGCPWEKSVYIHVARAHWEVYEFRGDHDLRLWFVGRATSKAKARRRCFVKVDSPTGGKT